MRNVSLRDHPREVHHRYQWSARLRDHSGIPGSISHNAVDWTANLGIPKLSFGALVFAFSADELCIGRLECLLVTYCFEPIQMFLCLFVLRRRLNEYNIGSIKIFAWNCPLCEQRLATFIDFLLRVQVLLCGLRVKFCFLEFFRE